MSRLGAADATLAQLPELSACMLSLLHTDDLHLLCHGQLALNPRPPLEISRRRPRSIDNIRELHMLGNILRRGSCPRNQDSKAKLPSDQLSLAEILADCQAKVTCGSPWDATDNPINYSFSFAQRVRKA